MKVFKGLICILTAAALLYSCAALGEGTDHVVEIALNDGAVLVNGEPAGRDETDAVYTAGDIVYYESGKDFTYGEGSEKDAHSAEIAAAHTVVHITQPGTYSVSGKLSMGQIAVDLGADAKNDPEACVTLILDGADIACEVAPAIIFYNVYECGSRNEETASKDADTSAAGASIIIADESVNNICGSYVADIYDPASVVLSGDGTEVEDAEKLHSYDGALYSRMSMNVRGGENGNGILYIDAENEGLCSELHLTLSGGFIEIASGNDGINANEDNLSVITINGGTLLVRVTGETGEGDGIDSNGWLVINDGTVLASACAHSADAGIDADKGIHINGGTIAASGHMLDRIEDGGQTYAVFSFEQEQDGETAFTLKGANGFFSEIYPENDYSILVYSDPDLHEGTYTLWSGETQLAGRAGGMGRGMGGKMPFGRNMPPMDGETPENPNPDESPEEMPKKAPSFDRMPEPMDGSWKKGSGFGFRDGENETGERSIEFEIKSGSNQFSAIAPAE